MNAIYLFLLVMLAGIAVGLLFKTIECVDLYRHLITQQQVAHDEWAAMVARIANDSPEDDSSDDLSEFWGGLP